MSDDLFTLEHVHAALNHYTINHGIENGLYPYSPAYWCVEQVAQLTDAEREAALFRLSVWDLINMPAVTVKELCKPGSDVWNYSIIATSADNSKNELLVSACAIWGWGLTVEFDSISYHLAASNLVFAMLAQEQHTRSILNDFEDLPNKEVRRKAARAKYEIYYGPLKTQCQNWAQEVIDKAESRITIQKLTEAVYGLYLGELKAHPKGTPEYRKIHPLNNNGEYLAEIQFSTIRGWVAPMVSNRRTSKNK
ncbi:hypothetical protein [Xenorhabdus sp. Sc-CR9]|uniref:hypothetical protein n=1 Tax=Xenorhabdus sp. Sc-CR9 TaxID=2584468 RepID=UPI001F3CC580|nr:hypothetical protein [Xenorhabdus sp. Sc-CR9]